MVAGQGEVCAGGGDREPGYHDLAVGLDGAVLNGEVRAKAPERLTPASLPVGVHAPEAAYRLILLRVRLRLERDQ